MSEMPMPESYHTVATMFRSGLSIRQMVDRLNQGPDPVPSPAGSRWHVSAVQHALARLRVAGLIPHGSPDPVRAATAARRAAGEVVAGRGRHALPRRQLVATEDQWAEWDEAAKKKGFQSWSEYVRDLQDRDVRSQP
jgi:hypothetical protein